MSENTVDKDMAHFLNREDRDHKMDEIHKAFDDIRKNIDSIITMIDEILLQEEDFMSSDREAYCIDCLSLDEQEFLMHGNQRLEPKQITSGGGGYLPFPAVFERRSHARNSYMLAEGTQISSARRKNRR